MWNTGQALYPSFIYLKDGVLTPGHPRIAASSGFTSEGRQEREIDRWTGAASAVMQMLYLGPSMSLWMSWVRWPRRGRSALGLDF